MLATDAAPLPFAVLRATAMTSPSSVLLWTDAHGDYCVDAIGSVPVSVLGLADNATSGPLRVDSALVATTSLAADPGSAVCSGDASACAQYEDLHGQPLDVRCVRGTLAGLDGVDWMAQAGSEDVLWGSVTSGGFCIEVPADSTLKFTPSYGHCGAEHVIDKGKQALCVDGDGCVDVGTIACCNSAETCGDQTDADCDGMVDEGCTCGGIDCVTSGDRCCTEQDTCGLRTQLMDGCVEPGAAGAPSTMCADDNSLGGTPLTGCCRPDMRCGLFDSQSFGCVPREQAQQVWPLTASLAPATCTP